QLAAVTAEQSRRRKLAQLVADHVLRDVDRHELVPVVHGERVADELRRDRRRARPGLQDLLLVAGVHRAQLQQPLLVDVRALLRGSAHGLVRTLTQVVRLPRLRPRTISLFDFFFRFRVFTPSGLPHGETGGRPPDVLPSPPPSGWSTGFMATPRTFG